MTLKKFVIKLNTYELKIKTLKINIDNGNI